MHDERGTADEPTREALRAATARAVRRTGIPGAQVAVRRDDELLWSACVGRLGHGPSDPAVDARVRRHDRFVVASVTKLVIACTTLSLVERGELDLDEPVASWLPEIPGGDAVTLRMLLAHRSGLPEYFRDERVGHKIQAEPFASWTRTELLEAVSRLGSEQAPDQGFAYRNTNYIAIGELLTRSTGRSVSELVADRVCRPLGLSTMSFDADPPAADPPGAGRLAAPHTRRLRVRAAADSTDGRLPSHALGEVWTDGGLTTSAEDLARFTDALFGGRLLGAAVLDDMTRRSASPGAAVEGVLGLLQAIYLGRVRRSYGLGVAVEQRASHTTVGHEGMYYGWSATTTFDPASRLTIAITTNLATIPVPAERLERSLREAVARAIALPP